MVTDRLVEEIIMFFHNVFKVKLWMRIGFEGMFDRDFMMRLNEKELNML